MLERGGTELFSKDQSICGVGNDGKDACEGDSGGPLVVNVEVRDPHNVRLKFSIKSGDFTGSMICRSR